MKTARCNGRSNLPTGLAVIHGRDGAASSFGQKANTRSASDGAGIPAKGALCNIPAFVAFWSPNTIEVRVGAGNLDRAPPIRALLIGRPSRLSLRLPLFLIVIYKGDTPLFSKIENLKYRQWTYSVLAKVDHLFSPPTSRLLPPSFFSSITLISPQSWRSSRTSQKLPDA